MDEETYCHQMLAEIEKAHRAAAEPYLRRLAAIVANRRPAVTFVSFMALMAFMA